MHCDALTFKNRSISIHPDLCKDPPLSKIPYNHTNCTKTYQVHLPQHTHTQSYQDHVNNLLSLIRHRHNPHQHPHLRLHRGPPPNLLGPQLSLPLRSSLHSMLPRFRHQRRSEVATTSPNRDGRRLGRRGESQSRHHGVCWAGVHRWSG